MLDADREVFVWVVEHRVPGLDWLFLALTVAGQAALVWIALAPGLALLAGRRPVPVTLVTAATVWTADVIAILLKTAFDRDRPYVSVAQADPLLRWDVSSSLPSGHAATSAAGALILAFMLGRWGWALGALAVAVCYSRVYVGVHYPLDILLGAAIGLAVAFAATVAVRRLLPTSRAPRRSGAATPGG